MSGFKINIKKDEQNRTRIAFMGAMDEYSDYSTLTGDYSGDIVLDLSRVEHINSTGIKHWVQWISQINHNETKFVFLNCPKPIVDQMNMVDGFLPPGSTIQSFNVPYYCERCDADFDTTFVLGREFNYDSGALELKFPDYPCRSTEKEDECELEPDVIEQKYFKFLQK